MLSIKSTRNCAIVLTAVVGLFFVLGCGPSAEKIKMTEFIQNYGKIVDEYSAVVQNGDNAKKSELEGKVATLMSEWNNIVMDLSGEVTPQVMNEMENEYKTITKKYNTLLGKS